MLEQLVASFVLRGINPSQNLKKQDNGIETIHKTS